MVFPAFYVEAKQIAHLQGKLFLFNRCGHPVFIGSCKICSLVDSVGHKALQILQPCRESVYCERADSLDRSRRADGAGTIDGKWRKQESERYSRIPYSLILY